MTTFSSLVRLATGESLACPKANRVQVADPAAVRPPLLTPIEQRDAHCNHRDSQGGPANLATSMLAPRCFGSGLEQACGDDGTDPNENHAADEFAALAGPGADPAA